MGQCELLWHDEWFHQGESPWSVFQKVQLVNQSKSENLLHFLGNSQLKERKKLWGSRAFGSLWDLADFDDEVLHKNHLLMVKRDNLELKDIITKKMQVSEEACWHKKSLQFCPECLTHGYHSLIHQIRLLYVCPFHHVPLRTSCENCGGIYHYYLYQENMSAPFACNCGHTYLPTRIFAQLRETFSNKIVTEEAFQGFLKQLNINNRVSYYYPKNLQYEQNCNPLQTFISLRKKTGKRGSAAYNIKEKTETQFNVIFQQRAVFKSIARHIRKRFLKTHLLCLKEMKHGSLRKGICCYALAYLNWRKDIEGDRNYNDVDRGFRKNVRGSHSSTFYTHVHMGLLDEMTTWINQMASKEDKEGLNAIQWSLNRIYPLLVWHHFLLWTHVVESFVKQENEWLILNILPFPKRIDFPLCLYGFDHEKQQLSFQRDDFTMKIKSKLYCYNKRFIS